MVSAKELEGAKFLGAAKVDGETTVAYFQKGGKVYRVSGRCNVMKKEMML